MHAKTPVGCGVTSRTSCTYTCTRVQVKQVHCTGLHSAEPEKLRDSRVVQGNFLRYLGIPVAPAGIPFGVQGFFYIFSDEKTDI
eukprot:93153-Rhodomonas_salina.1